MTSQNYWAKRFDELTKRDEKEVMREMAIIYDELCKYTEAQLWELLTNFRDEANVDYFTYEKLYKLEEQLKEKCVEMGKKEISLLDDRLTKHCVDVSAILDKKLPMRSDIKPMDYETAKHIAAQDWVGDGLNYSRRIWTNQARLRAMVRDNLARCMNGNSTSGDFIKELRKAFNVSYNQAATLVRTELAHCRMATQLEKAKQAGYTYYTYHTRKDGKVCSPECENLEGKRFSIDQAKAGVNYPCMHPNCRCWVV